MMYVDFNAGNKSYKLRLTTRNVVALEKQIGKGVLSIFGNGDQVPALTEMVVVLWASLQAYEHGISLNDTYDIFDAWLDDGHQLADFLPIIIELYQMAGVIGKPGKSEKN